MSDESRLFCVGTNHRNANIALRENLYIEPEILSTLLEPLKEQFKLSELMILSTCNRLEISGVASETQPDEIFLQHIFVNLQQQLGRNELRPDVDIIPHLYLLQSHEAKRHLLRVVASLDSLVVGETQITGQFKTSVEISRRQTCIGPVLDRLARRALSTAKKIRTETSLGEKTVSIASAASELAQTIFEDLTHHDILIVGAGEMARILAEHLAKKNPSALAIANRSEAAARKILRSIDRHEYIPIHQLSSSLHRFDIILTATGASEYVIDKASLEKQMKTSRKTNKLCIDISLPRNIDPSASEIDDVFLFDIDDLKQIVDTNKKARNDAADLAEKFIDQAMTLPALEPDNHRALLADTRDFVQQVIAKEFKQSQKNFKEIDQSHLKALQDLEQVLVKKISGSLSQNIKEVLQTSQVDIQDLKDIFRLPKERK
ncbi:glutamyl-tRNA reductase [Oligoflexaceae bacterium]|nr:glutamyl-tRNA reductase [Oligoflexaceae bacterium]